MRGSAAAQNPETEGRCIRLACFQLGRSVSTWPITQGRHAPTTVITLELTDLRQPFFLVSRTERDALLSSRPQEHPLLMQGGRWIGLRPGPYSVPGHLHMFTRLIVHRCAAERNSKQRDPKVLVTFVGWPVASQPVGPMA